MNFRAARAVEFKTRTKQRFSSTLLNPSGAPLLPVIGPQLEENNSPVEAKEYHLWLYKNSEYASIFDAPPPLSSATGQPSPVPSLSSDSTPLTSIPPPSSHPRQWIVFCHVREELLLVDNFDDITPSSLRSCDVDYLRDLVPCRLVASPLFAALFGGKFTASGSGPSSFTNMSLAFKGSHQVSIPTSAIPSIIHSLQSSGACKSLQVADPYGDGSPPIGLQAFKGNCESFSSQLLAGVVRGKFGVFGVEEYGGKCPIFRGTPNGSTGEKLL